MKNCYFVERSLTIGEYDKSTSTLVIASSEKKAMGFALLGECHGSLQDGNAEFLNDDFTAISDMGGEMVYRIDSCKLVPTEEIETLKKYLFVYDCPNDFKLPGVCDE